MGHLQGHQVERNLAAYFVAWYMDPQWTLAVLLNARLVCNKALIHDVILEEGVT